MDPIAKALFIAFCIAPLALCIAAGWGWRKLAWACLCCSYLASLSITSDYYAHGHLESLGRRLAHYPGDALGILGFALVFLPLSAPLAFAAGFAGKGSKQLMGWAARAWSKNR